MNDNLYRLRQQQMLAMQQDAQNWSDFGTSVGGLIRDALAKRSDGINDSIGNGIRYTNDTKGGGAFDKAQQQSLVDIATNGLSTANNTNAKLAGKQFTVNGQQYQADNNGLISAVQQPAQQSQQPISIGIGGANIDNATNGQGLFGNLGNIAIGIGKTGLDRVANSQGIFSDPRLWENVFGL